MYQSRDSTTNFATAACSMCCTYGKRRHRCALGAPCCVCPSPPPTQPKRAVVFFNATSIHEAVRLRYNILLALVKTTGVSDPRCTLYGSNTCCALLPSSVIHVECALSGVQCTSMYDSTQASSPWADNNTKTADGCVFDKGRLLAVD